MPVISRKQFAALCGDDEKYLNVYVSRKKVLTCGVKGKEIDTENPVNVEYLNVRRAQNGVKGEIVIEQTPRAAVEKPVKTLKNSKKREKIAPNRVKNSKPAKIIPEKETAPAKKSIRELQLEDALRAHASNTVALNTLQKETSIKKAQIDIEKAELQLQKAAGKLLPIELVHGIHKVYARNIFVSFETACDKIAMKFCNILAGGDISQLNRITTELKNELNKTIGKAGKETKIGIDRLIDDYAESRVRGEKKI